MNTAIRLPRRFRAQAPIAPISGLLERIAAYFRRVREARATRAFLCEASPRMLRDVGLGDASRDSACAASGSVRVADEWLMRRG